MERYSPSGPKPVVRKDLWGDGAFGASRGGKFHDGVDLIVTPPQPVFSMIGGMAEKVEYPYRSDLSYTGIQIANSKLRVEIWYMAPYANLIGKFVQPGQAVGYAQDISKKYGEDEKKGIMTPHIHVRVTMLAFTTLSGGRYVSYEQHIDPALLLGDLS